MNFKLERDVTLVVGVDEKYCRQLETVFRLWLKFWPALRNMQWVFWYDGKCPSLHGRIEQAIAGHRHYAATRFQAWLPKDTGQFEDQRDRMLAGWALLPPMLVATPYWLKLDVDAYPVRPIAGSFPLARWFEGHPAVVGHSWNYTKHRGTKGDWFEILDKWADGRPLFRNTKPLGLSFPVGSRRLVHARFASYISFFNTCWTLDIAEDVVASINDMALRIPVPSQDTFLWYCAQRLGRKIVRVKMKSHGWTNQARFERLQQTVKELMT